MFQTNNAIDWKQNIDSLAVKQAEFSIELQRGNHQLEVVGLSDCCDG